MKLHYLIALALVVPSALQLHAKNKKPDVPAVFGQARYVYVEAMDGQEFNSNLNPDDRIAIANVRDGLDDWKRYSITASRDEADLVIVVRKGRVAGAHVGIAPGRIPLPGSGGQPGGLGAGIGSEAGPSDDYFEVCQVNGADGKLSAPLWHQSMPEGLDAPRVTLLAQFEEAVDKAYPPPPPGPTPQSKQSGQQPGQQTGQQTGQTQKP